MTWITGLQKGRKGLQDFPFAPVSDSAVGQGGHGRINKSAKVKRIPLNSGPAKEVSPCPSEKPSATLCELQPWLELCWGAGGMIPSQQGSLSSLLPLS